MKVPMNFHRIAEVKDGNMEVSLYAALECSKRGQNAEKQILDRYCRKKEPLGHRRLGATGLLGLAVVLFAIPSPAQAPAGTASWTYKANLSVQHTGPASAALGGLAYAAGGWNSNYLCSYLNTVEAYNPATNQWSTVAPMPTAREHARAAVWSGKLYVVGGSAGCGPRTGANEVYDPSTNRWTSLAPMPTARTGHAVDVINGILYAAGGDSGTLVEAYNISTNIWSRVASMAVSRSGASAVAFNGRLYVFGGSTPAVTTSVEVYDPAANAWSTGHAMPTARSDAAAVTANGTIYLIGGSSSAALSSVDAYNPATDTWSSVAPLQTARISLGAAAINNTLYAFAGMTGGSAYDSSSHLTSAEALSLGSSTPVAGNKPVISSILNATSLQASQGIAPFSYMTLTGTNLAPDTPAGGRVWRGDEIVNGTLPVSLDGVSATVGGKPAAIEFVSATQINAIAPDDAPTGASVPVVVTTSAGASNSVSVKVQTFSPSFFLWPGNQPVATRGDYSLVARSGTFAGVTTTPARPGEIISLWGNGFGPTTPPVASGKVTAADAEYDIATAPVIMIGGVAADYLGGALTPGNAALYQINIRVPAGAGGDQGVRVSQGGVQGPDGMVLAVQGAGASAFYTMSVTRSGSGSGAVTSSPAGIACGSTCSFPWPAGTSVTLTAAPDAGSAFSGWAGACNGGGTCTVTMDGDKALTASFAPAGSSTLTVVKNGNAGGSGVVTSSPAGISCGSVCQAEFPLNTVVTLTASDGTVAGFTGWLGACTGFQPTCTVAMDGPKSVTATFLTGPTQILQVFKGTVANTVGGGGTVTSSPVGIHCGNICGTRFTAHDSVTLTAVPNTGSTFAGWISSRTCPSSRCTGSNPSCVIQMDADECATASFAGSPETSTGEGGPTDVGLGIGVYVLMQGTNGSGTVTSNPAGIDCHSYNGTHCNAQFALGLPIVLTANPSGGYVFDHWSFDYRMLHPPDGSPPVVSEQQSSENPYTVPAYNTDYGAATAYFTASSTPPVSMPQYCNVSCSGDCFSPAQSLQSYSCAACSALYNWCRNVAVGCSNYKIVLYWNACH